jgi:hypothetical protein
MSFVAKYWIISAIYNMDDETMEKICGNTILKDIPIEDIVEDFSFSFNLQSAHSVDDMIEVQNIIKMIELMGNLRNPD